MWFKCNLIYEELEYCFLFPAPRSPVLSQGLQNQHHLPLLAFGTLEDSVQTILYLFRPAQDIKYVTWIKPLLIELTSGRINPCSIDASILLNTKTPLKICSGRLALVISFVITSSQAFDRASQSFSKSAAMRDPPVRTTAKIRLQLCSYNPISLCIMHEI